MNKENVMLVKLGTAITLFPTVAKIISNVSGKLPEDKEEDKMAKYLEMGSRGLLAVIIVDGLSHVFAKRIDIIVDVLKSQG